MEKVVQQADFESSLCSAFSGEDFKHTTIGRGNVNMQAEMCIYIVLNSYRRDACERYSY